MKNPMQYPFERRENDELLSSKQPNLWMKNVERTTHASNNGLEIIGSFAVLLVTLVAMYYMCKYFG